MAALDTNILVRWLVNDDAAQCAKMSSLLAATAANGERLFVTITVMLELVGVAFPLWFQPKRSHNRP